MTYQTLNTDDQSLFYFFKQYDPRAAIRATQVGEISWICSQIEKDAKYILLIYENQKIKILVKRLFVCNWNAVVPRDF